MLFFYLALFYLGCILGSFIYVVVSRSLKGQSWVKGRSRCDRCRKKIAWFDNIPLLSFLSLDGKCRHCRQPIESLHFWAELICGLIMLWWWQLVGKALLGGFDWVVYLLAAIWLAVGLLCLVILLTDVKKMIIPDQVTIILLILALGFLGLLGLVQGNVFVIQALLSSLVVLLVFGLIFILTSGCGMGLGDVKLAPVLALFLGWPAVVVGFFAAVLSGGLVGVILLITGQHRRRQPIAFGPFLIFGFLLATLYGKAIWHWYWTLIF